METVTYFRIKYENVFSGKSLHYMNVGFPSENSAQQELDKIIKEQERLKALGVNFQENRYNSAVFSGKNFEIEPVTLKNKTVK